MRYRLGLVLSGGGVRGVAHAGALAALGEHGIEPDCVSGTSAGAIVGALWAAGQPPEAIVEFFATRSPFKVTRLALARTGIIDTEKVRDDLLDYLPADSFEALERRLFVTATDLVTARLRIFQSGPLVAAVLASSAVPMIFTPVTIGDRLYADGGILNNFPVEPLSGLCDTLIGVYASPLRSVRREDIDDMRAVYQRALEVGMFHTAKAKFHACDVVLCPPELAGFGGFDTRHIREVFDIGYRAALRRMDDVEDALRAADAVRRQS